jgi:hypothetical protein
MELDMGQTAAAAVHPFGSSGSLGPAVLPTSSGNNALHGPLVTGQDGVGMGLDQQATLAPLKDTKDVSEAVEEVLELLHQMQVSKKGVASL